MTATPVVNELGEGKPQLELITGKRYDDISTTMKQQNAIALYGKLSLNSIINRIL